MTGHAIQGGADQDKLLITSSGEVLTSRTVPDFEMPSEVASTAPTDAVGSNEDVLVRATSGTLTFAPGETSKTAR